MAVDVVVVNYKTHDLLADFVLSYEKYAFAGCRLTIVDICPDILWTPSEDYGYISLVDNVGYGRACNLGASSGLNDVILLANADTLLTDRFAECYDALDANPEWGVLGPRQVNEQGSITAGGIFGTDRSPAQRGWNERDMGQYSDIREDALTVSGALYFIKRVVWTELTNCEFFQLAQPGVVGAFLETPHYFDETFCSYHAREHGYKCVYYGAVQMVHYWHRASPHGGWADNQFNTSQAMHRAACGIHGIECE